MTKIRNEDAEGSDRELARLVAEMFKVSLQSVPNPKPSATNPKSQTSEPTIQTPKPEALNPKPET